MPIPGLMKEVSRPPAPRVVSAPPASPPVPVPPPKPVIPPPVAPAPDPDARPLTGKTLPMRVPDLSAVTPSVPASPRPAPAPPVSDEPTLMERTLPMQAPDLSAVSSRAPSSPHPCLRLPPDSPLMERTTSDAGAGPFRSVSGGRTTTRYTRTASSVRRRRSRLSRRELPARVARPQVETHPRHVWRGGSCLVGRSDVGLLEVSPDKTCARAAPAGRGANAAGDSASGSNSRGVSNSTPCRSGGAADATGERSSGGCKENRRTQAEAGDRATAACPRAGATSGPTCSPSSQRRLPALRLPHPAPKTLPRPRPPNSPRFRGSSRSLCNYGLKEATFTFSSGGQTLFEETLKGKKKKEGFLGIKGSYQGTFTHTITVPAGASEVSIHVVAKDGATDLTSKPSRCRRRGASFPRSPWKLTATTCRSTGKVPPRKIACEVTAAFFRKHSLGQTHCIASFTLPQEPCRMRVPAWGSDEPQIRGRSRGASVLRLPAPSTGICLVVSESRAAPKGRGNRCGKTATARNAMTGGRAWH